MHLHQVGFNGAIEEQCLPQAFRRVPGWIAVFELKSPNGS